MVRVCGAWAVVSAGGCVSWRGVPARTSPRVRFVVCTDLWTHQASAQGESSPPPWRVAAGGVRVCGGSEQSAPVARPVHAATSRDAAPWAVRMAWGLAEGVPQAAVLGASEPNNALEPTPTASAPASLWLLARLTAGVRLKFHRSGKEVCPG